MDMSSSAILGAILGSVILSGEEIRNQYKKSGWPKIPFLPDLQRLTRSLDCRINELWMCTGSETAEQSTYQQESARAPKHGTCITLDINY